ncbi:hypothetical protein [Microbulbifer sp.]|uniref:hypothetical protein n=1 Tax=Microbulbifer sp. TaxID=1908541 RepID=UPI0025896108|nr:hypothetical protein [Microbulbifer sp.]
MTEAIFADSAGKTRADCHICSADRVFIPKLSVGLGIFHEPKTNSPLLVECLTFYGEPVAGPAECMTAMSCWYCVIFVQLPGSQGRICGIIFFLDYL